MLHLEAILRSCVCVKGDGVPPSEARGFCDWLNSADAPALGDGSPAAEQPGALKYSVLAAGDKSYINFCACGRMLDARFEALGAQRCGTSSA